MTPEVEKLLQKRKANDLRMIQDPFSWPRFPVLPIKNPLHKKDSGVPDMGILVNDGKPTIYFINLWELKAGSLKDQLKGISTKTYPSYEAMLDDGWVID